MLKVRVAAEPRGIEGTLEQQAGDLLISPSLHELHRHPHALRESGAELPDDICIVVEEDGSQAEPERD